MTVPAALAAIDTFAKGKKMKKLLSNRSMPTTTSFAAAAFAAVALAAALPAIAQPMPEGFLCCNMRSDSSGWISDSNYMEAGKRVVPLGTPAKVTGYGRYRVSIEAEGKTLWLGNDYSRELDLPKFAERYVVATDPKARLATFPADVQKAIVAGRVAKGMTREQVLMAVGYPITSENPTLDAPAWRYWLNSFAPFTIVFGGNGRVEAVETDPQTRLVIEQAR